MRVALMRTPGGLGSAADLDLDVVLAAVVAELDRRPRLLDAVADHAAHLAAAAAEVRDVDVVERVAVAIARLEPRPGGR